MNNQDKPSTETSAHPNSSLIPAPLRTWAYSSWMKSISGVSLIMLSFLTSAHADTPRPEPSKSIMPGTGVEALAEVAQKDLMQLMSEGPCPCDPNKRTLLQCIQAKDCPAATSLAAYGVELYKSGMGSEQVTEAVIKKFIEEFTPPVEFDLSKSPWKGDPNAPITIVEFADFECPHCALMGTILKDVLKERPKAIKIYFKQFPLPFHKMAPLASQATLAAHRQDQFWPMHDIIFANQQNLSPEQFAKFAEQLGLNMMVFRADFMNSEIQKQIEAEREEGVKAGLQGTPTLYFNGKVYGGEINKESIISHIDTLIARTKEAKK